METNFRTSFVPKKTLVTQAPSGNGSSVSIFLAIASVLFVFSLLSSGGVFLYRAILEKSIAEKSEALEKAKKEFELPFIETARNFDAKISAAREILASHSIASPVFGLLSGETLQTVRLTEFSYTRPDGTPRVTLKGEARGANSSVGYGSVALQSDVFLGNEKILNPLFGDVHYNTADGSVEFKFNSELLDGLMLYANTDLYGAAGANPRGGQGGEDFSSATSSPRSSSSATSSRSLR